MANWQEAFQGHKGHYAHHYTALNIIDATIVPTPYSDGVNATRFNCLVGDAEMADEVQTAEGVAGHLAIKGIDPESGWR